MVNDIISRIKAIRRNKGISQEAIAYDLGIDYSTYGKIERGQIALTVDRLSRIAEILGVPVSDLYDFQPVTKTDASIAAGHKVFSNEQEYRMRLNRCLADLEIARKESEYLRIQLRDKERIIELLEHQPQPELTAAK